MGQAIGCRRKASPKPKAKKATVLLRPVEVCMEQFVAHLLHVGAWIFGIVFIFAIIGVIAVIAWIVNLFRKTEAVVETGVHNAENTLHRRDP